MRVVTTAKERERYGIGLRAEPDPQELGRRLKSDFTSVATAVRGLHSITCLISMTTPVEKDQLL